MKLRFLTLIVLMLSLVGASEAQDIVTAKQTADYFLRVNQAYSDCRSISMDIQHSFYKTYSDSVPEASFQGYYFRKNTMENSSIAGIFSVQDERYRITIDTANKDISISNPVLSSAANPAAVLGILQLSKKIYLTKNPASDVFLMVFADDNPEFSSLRISIDPRTNFIQSIVIYHSEEEEYEDHGKKIVTKGRTEIHYENLKKNPGLPDRKFSLKDYISFVNNKAVPAKEYSDFDVIDNVIR
jgi:hypothetical protein